MSNERRDVLGARVSGLNSPQAARGTGERRLRPPFPCQRLGTDSLKIDLAPPPAALEAGCRNQLMADQSERAARLLVRSLYLATDGERRWWVLPSKLNDVTKEAITLVVERGWMLDRGDSVCLTDAARDLVKYG